VLALVGLGLAALVARLVGADQPVEQFRLLQQVVW
jgi:hypothetical protein